MKLGRSWRKRHESAQPELKFGRAQFMWQHEIASRGGLPEGPRWQRILGRTALALWIFTLGFLWYYYAGTRPSTPHPETGNIYPLNTHGSIAYLTYRDWLVLRGSEALVGLMVLVSVFTSWRRGEFPRRRSGPL